MTLSRHRLAPFGIAFVAVGLAQRLAFFTWLGLFLVAVGFLLIGLAAIRDEPAPTAGDSAYPVLLAVMILVAAFVPFRPGPPELAPAGLTAAAAFAFYACSLSRRLVRWRLYLTAALLIAAHAVFITEVPEPPHQDVFRFLNRGIDVLILGHNPYAAVPASLGGPFVFTYPPGVFLLLTPFRVVFGDIRWGYIAAETVVVLLLGWLLRVRTGLARWQEALLLMPLALPRVSQGFFVYSNHEWVLLAIAVGVLWLAFRANWIGAGLLLGVGIASKQYFLVFPALFVLPALRRRSLLLGLATALAICVPFLVWDAGAFFRDVFANLGSAPDPERLTLWAALNHLGVGGRLLSLLLAGLGALLTLALLVISRRELCHSLLACGLALAIVSLCSPFAAYNYYAYALTFCIWGLIIPLGWERRRVLAELNSPASAGRHESVLA